MRLFKTKRNILYSNQFPILLQKFLLKITAALICNLQLQSIIIAVLKHKDILIKKSSYNCRTVSLSTKVNDSFINAIKI